jgi:hypothetical protein
LNVKLAGESESVTTTPVPVKLTMRGVLLSPLTILIEPVRVPVPVGVKVTRIAQLLLAARLLPQLFVCE